MNHRFSFRAAAVLIAASSLAVCQMPGAAQAEDFVLTSPQIGGRGELARGTGLAGFRLNGRQPLARVELAGRARRHPKPGVHRV